MTTPAPVYPPWELFYQFSHKWIYRKYYSVMENSLNEGNYERNPGFPGL